MLDSSIVAFTLAALLVTITPGPDTFLVISHTMRGGIRRGLAASAGIASGGVYYIALFSLGVAQVLVLSPVVFFAVKITGAVYLLYLGGAALYSALAKKTDENVTLAPIELAHTDLRSAYFQGLVTNTFNPKVAVFYLAFLPQFISTGDSFALKSALLIGIHYTLGFLWLSAITVMANRFNTFLCQSSFQRWLEGVIGAVMMAFGIKLALATR